MNNLDSPQVKNPDYNDSGFIASNFVAAFYSFLLLLLITFVMALIIKPENIGLVFGRLFSGELLLYFIVAYFASWSLMLTNPAAFFLFIIIWLPLYIASNRGLNGRKRLITITIFHMIWLLVGIYCMGIDFSAD